MDVVGCTDIDDALHIKKLENGNFQVGVRIVVSLFGFVVAVLCLICLWLIILVFGLIILVFV